MRNKQKLRLIKLSLKLAIASFKSEKSALQKKLTSQFLWLHIFFAQI